MEKTLCYTVADKGSVCINGVCIPCHDDGWKEIVLTDEREKTHNRPWIDLRTTDLKIWESDCSDDKVFTFNQKELETWGVEICTASVFNKIYLIKY